MDKNWVNKKKEEIQKDSNERKEKLINTIKEKYPWLNLDFFSSLIEKEDSKYGIFTYIMDWLEDESGLYDEKLSTNENKVKYLKDVIDIEKLYRDSKIVRKEDLIYLDSYLDSEEVEFEGDIIITDPCYFMKERDYSNKPKWENYHKFRTITDYPDYNIDTHDSFTFRMEEKALDEADKRWEKEHPDDWSISCYGEELGNLGIKHFMTRDTLYGDWSCTTYNTDTKEAIGEFCADAGMVTVVSLDEVLSYNPDFNYHIDKPWTTTLIKDFKGTVQFVVKHVTGVYDFESEFHKKGDSWEDYEVEVIGKGINKKTGEVINFVGTQTGL